MSGTDYTMITEEERTQVTNAVKELYRSLQRMEYMTPYSYIDLFKDEDLCEEFTTLSKMLSHIVRTYIK